MTCLLRFRSAPIRFRTSDRRCQTPILRFRIKDIRVQTPENRFLLLRRDLCRGEHVYQLYADATNLRGIGGRDGFGGHPRETTLNCLQPASRPDAVQARRFKSPAHQVELKRVAGNSSQFISIYAGAIQHEDLLIQNQDSAIPAQTALGLVTQHQFGASQVAEEMVRAEIDRPRLRGR